jgi:hypothetical protein
MENDQNLFVWPEADAQQFSIIGEGRPMHFFNQL